MTWAIDEKTITLLMLLYCPLANWVKTLFKWLEEEKAEEVEDILLSPAEECLDVDTFGVSIIAGMTESGKTNH